MKLIITLAALVFINNSYAQTVNIQKLLWLGNQSMPEISEYLMENNWTKLSTERDYGTLASDYGKFPTCMMSDLSLGGKDSVPFYCQGKESGVFKTTFKKTKEYIILFWYYRGIGDEVEYTQGIVYETANNAPSENIKYLKSHGYSLNNWSSEGFLSYSKKDGKEDVIISQIEKSPWLGYYIDLCGRYRHSKTTK